MYLALARMSVAVYAGMAITAYMEGDWKRGTLALLFSVANAIMFVL